MGPLSHLGRARDGDGIIQEISMEDALVQWGGAPVTYVRTHRVLDTVISAETRHLGLKGTEGDKMKEGGRTSGNLLVGCLGENMCFSSRGGRMALRTEDGAVSAGRSSRSRGSIIPAP